MINSIYQKINNNQVPFSQNKIIIDFFEEQVKKNPHHPAIISENKTLSYLELHKKSNYFAHKLIQLGVLADDIIPIFMPRCEEMIVAVFAVMKAGAAYLPLDISLPSKRIEYILGNVKPKCCLSLRDMTTIKGLCHTIIEIGDFWIDDTPEVIRNVSPSDLAYVCYTSGSTGQPKGVMIEHRSLVNRLEWMQSQFPIRSADCLFQKTSFSFDVSIWEIFWWSMVGASVVLLPPNKEHDPKTMVKLIRKHQISVIHFVPSVLQIFLEYLSYHPEITLDSLKWVFSSGEALTPMHVKRFHSIFNQKNIQLVNLYGPTEATIDVSSFVCLPNMIHRDIPIGRPIQNTEFYIYTEDKRLGEIDENGELLIAGVGLARGYLNDPLLTNEKFISLPELNGRRVYKTGDLAKIQTDGECLYLGRIDDQIKIRGLRIELGEIENHLSQHPFVKESAVIAIKNELQDPYLVACVTLADGKIIKSDNLIDFLSLHIPRYMIPQRYKFLDAFPVKPNGKLNKKQLEQMILCDEES